MVHPRQIIATSLLAGLISSLTVTGQEKETGLVFKGHTDAVYSVAQTPDGKLLVTGGFDRTVRVWDAATGKQLRSLGGPTGHQSLVLSVATSPSGELMASGGSDNALYLWDVPLRTHLRQFAHNSPVVSAGLSADGKTLAALASDGSVRTWQTADGKTLRDIPAVRGAGVRGQLSPNGQQFVTAGDDGFVRWFNLTDGKLLGAIGAARGPITGLAVTPGNAVITADEEGSLRFWQPPTTPAKPLPAHADAITRVQASADGGFLITVGNDNVVKSVSASSGTVGREFTAPAAVSAVALWPNGSTVAIGLTTGNVILWNRSEGKVIETIAAHSGRVSAIAVNGSGNQWVTIGADGAAGVWAFPIVKPKPMKDPKDGKESKDGGPAKPSATFKLTGEPIGVVFHPSANQLLVLGADKTVKLIDVPGGKEAKTITTLPAVPKAFALSRDFTTLAVSLDKSIRLINLADGKETVAIPLPVDATSLAFNADKSRLVTGHADKIARIWDAGKGGFIHAVEHSGPITGVVFHQNQQAVCVVSSDKTGAILPIQQPKIVQASSKPIRILTLTPNGSHVVIGGDDPIVRALNAGNGLEEKKFEGATGPVHAVAVGKSVQVVAFGGADKTIRLHQFNDLRPIATIPAPGAVRALAFHPNGNIVLAITDDKLLTAWNITQQAGQPLPDDFGSIVQQWSLPDAGTGMFVTEKGELFVSLADKTVKQFKVALNTPLRNLPGHPNLVDAVAFSPDGRFLASGCHDGNVRIFEMEKFAVVKTIAAHTSPAPPAAIYSVTWSPDGKQLLTTSYDKSMKLWDAAAGTLIREFKGYAAKTFEKGHQDQVFTAVFTKDGKTIISGSSDRRIKKWNVADGSVIAEFVNPGVKGEPGQAHPGGVYALRLTPDEKYLVSAGPAPRNKGYVAIWTLADGKLVSGTETNTGPIYSAILSPDAKSLIAGTGPKVRQVPEAEAVVIPLGIK